MAKTIAKIRIQNKYDTQANWEANDPVLLKGELAVTAENGKIKVGDGTKKWSELSYQEADKASAVAEKLTVTDYAGTASEYDGSAAVAVNVLEAVGAGKANGVATLDDAGLIPSAQLPSYVDDIVEVKTKAELTADIGSKAKIYVVTADTDENNGCYRYSGTEYIRIAAELGSADTAMKLATARKIAVSGDATGETEFDGEKDVEIALTLKDSGVTAGAYGSATEAAVVTVDAKGIVTAAETVKITPKFEDVTDKPTTLAGYGITDAASFDTTTGVGLTGEDTKLATWKDASENVIGSIDAEHYTGSAAKVDNALTVDGKTYDGSEAVTVDDLAHLTTAEVFTGEKTFTQAIKLAEDGSATISATEYTGNAATATKLAKAITLTVSGDAAGTVSLDGSADAELALTIEEAAIKELEEGYIFDCGSSAD